MTQPELQTYPVTLKLSEFGVTTRTKNLSATIKLRTPIRARALRGRFEVNNSQLKRANAEGILTFNVYASKELNDAGVADAYYLLNCQYIDGMRDRLLWVPTGGGDVSQLLPLSSDGQNVPAPLLATELEEIHRRLGALEAQSGGGTGDGATGGGATGGGGGVVELPGSAGISLSVAAVANVGVGAPSSTINRKISNSSDAAYDRRYGFVGADAGSFYDPVDFVFGDANTIFVLERNRVQRLNIADNTEALTNTSSAGLAADTLGNYVSLAQYDLGAFTTATDLPTSIAFTLPTSAAPGDLTGARVWVAYPTLGALVAIDPDGKAMRYNWSFATDADRARMPSGARALASSPDFRSLWALGYAASNTLPGSDVMAVLSHAGTVQNAITLSQPVRYGLGIQPKPGGGFGAIDAVRRQIFVYDANGNLTQTRGSGYPYREPVTAPLNTQFLQSFTFDAQGRVIGQRANYFSRIEENGDGLFVAPKLSAYYFVQSGSPSNWGEPPQTVIRRDPNGRLWALALINKFAGGGEIADPEHRPLLVRLKESIWTDTKLAHSFISFDTAGINAALDYQAPYGVYYEGETGQVNLKLDAGIKNLASLWCAWDLLDEGGKTVGSGTLPVALQTDAASYPIEFPLPQLNGSARCGSYTVVVRLARTAGGPSFSNVSKRVSVTPAWPQLNVLSQRLDAGEKGSGIYDPPGAGFAGQVIRLNGSGTLASSIAQNRAYIVDCKARDVPHFLQVTNPSEVAEENIKGLVRGVGDVLEWLEILNEPTTGVNNIGVPRALELLALARQWVNEANAETGYDVKLLAPCLVGFNRAQLTQWFAGGGGALVDGFSNHDYQGNNGYHPVHSDREWKFVRDAMAANGCANKPMWQTEHGVLCSLGNVSRGFLQMTRMLLQRDVAASNGVPAERNAVFYLNSHGFNNFKSWLYDGSGFFPSALACRTHWALVGRKPFVDRLNFGTDGNRLYFGAGYEDATGTVYSFTNMGAVRPASGFEARSGDRDSATLAFAVTGASGGVTVYDAWGNGRAVPIVGGVLSLRLTQEPQFVVLPQGARLMAPVVDYGDSQIQGGAGVTLNWSGNNGLMADWNGVTINSQFGHNFAVLTDGTVDNPVIAVTNVGEADIEGGDKWWQGNFTLSQDATKGSVINFDETLTATFDAPKTANRVVFWGCEADNGWAALLDYDFSVRKADGTWEIVHQVRSGQTPTTLCATGDGQAIGWGDASKHHILEFARREITGFALRVLKTSYGDEPDEIAQQVRRALYGSSNPAQLIFSQIEVF